MTNIIAMRASRTLEQQGQAALSAMFADQRRLRGDVFWLKENAEWLGILASTQSPVPPEVLAPFEAFYAELPTQLGFFPQYYRFFLSLCLDLEDLGMPGQSGQRLCDWVAAQDLAKTELSDLQRAEAQRLLARRGADRADPGLKDRLHGFIEASGTFALPNKKAAYELTHIVFYLSEYGRVDPHLGAEAIASLEYAGLLAFLDQNFDLLAEICTALRFARARPNLVWEDHVQRFHTGCRISGHRASPSVQDGYHGFLVSGWLATIAGRRGFCQPVPAGPVVVDAPFQVAGALRDLSQNLFEMGAGRSGNWARMRRVLLPAMPACGRDIVEAAERSCDRFEAFFEGFARAACAENGVTLQ